MNVGMSIGSLSHATGAGKTFIAHYRCGELTFSFGGGRDVADRRAAKRGPGDGTRLCHGGSAVT